MDDLLALLDDDSLLNNEETKPADSGGEQGGGRTQTRCNDDHLSHSSTVPKRNVASNHFSNNTNSSHSTIDPLTKIRIVNRQVSKVDLVDIFAPFSFHTTAILASMPTKDLASIIAPTSKTNSNYIDSSLSGRTHAATMGILFKNSGTRISKNTGRAFTIVTIGDLNTGPTISVMLFGQAYSKYTTRLKHGDVVAFVGMNLLPIKDNYGKETRISFSVNDVDQVICVGKALDYGICSGSVFGKSSAAYQKNQYGGEKKRCQNYVDLRIGKFCQYHIKQQIQQATNNSTLTSSSSSSSSKATSSRTGKENKMNPVQAMKIQRAEKVMKRHAVLGNRLTSSITSHLKMQSLQQGNNVMTMVMPMHGSKNLARTVVTGMNTNNNLSSANGAMMNKMKQDNSTRKMNIPNHKKGGIRNPYNMKTSSLESTTTIQKRLNSKEATKDNMKNNHDLLGSALNTNKKTSDVKGYGSSQSLANKYQKKRKLVQANTVGFDGQVFIPKPSKLFARNKMSSSSSSMMPSLTASLGLTNQQAPVTPSPNQKAAVLERQRNFAAKIRLKTSINKTQTSTNINTQSTSKAEDKNDFLGFGSMDDSRRAKLLSSKSKYDMEANAELFAKSRNVLTELEKKETSRDKRNTGKSNQESMISSQWFCVTCNRKTKSSPTICIRQNHSVKRVRQLQQKESTEQKRNGLSTKSASDGGLVLGAGLEWSGWNRK